jgi:hypothetical protein
MLVLFVQIGLPIIGAIGGVLVDVDGQDVGQLLLERGLAEVYRE